MGNQPIAPPLLNSEYLTIHLFENKYTPKDDGIFVQGSINLKLIKQMECKDIELEIYCLEGYTNNDLYLKSINTICKIPLNIKSQLNIKENFIFLQPETYNFVFSFKVNYCFQPSFEYYSDVSRITLRYILKAQVLFNEYQKENDIISETYLQILSNQIKNVHPERYFSSKNVYKLGTSNRGISKCIVFLNKTNFTFNEKIPITIRVNNSQSSIKATSIKITLYRVLEYKKNSSVLASKTDKFNRYTFNINVEKGKIGIFRYEIELKDNNYNYLKSPYFSELYGTNNDWISFVPSINGAIIDCKYNIKVSLYYNHFVGFSSRPRVVIPIFVTHNSKYIKGFPEPFGNDNDLVDDSQNINLNKNAVIDNILNNDNENKDIIDNNKNDVKVNNKKDEKKDNKNEENKGIALGKNYGANDLILDEEDYFENNNNNQIRSSIKNNYPIVEPKDNQKKMKIRKIIIIKIIIIIKMKIIKISIIIII